MHPLRLKSVFVKVDKGTSLLIYLESLKVFRFTLDNVQKPNVLEKIRTSLVELFIILWTFFSVIFKIRDKKYF